MTLKRSSYQTFQYRLIVHVDRQHGDISNRRDQQLLQPEHHLFHGSIPADSPSRIATDEFQATSDGQSGLQPSLTVSDHGK